MKSTPERAEALKTALNQGLDATFYNTLREMLSECEQELPKPLVFESQHSGQKGVGDHQFTSTFSRPLTVDDLEAIRAALKKAFPP